jgi:hypothetical protein
MDELRDIKPLVPLSLAIPWWVWGLVGVGLAAVAALLLVWQRRKRRAVTPTIASPAEAARLALEAVRGLAPATQAGAEQLQGHVAAVLRLWLTGVKDLHATDLTTEELAADERVESRLGDDGRDLLIDLLAFADKVRFAGLAAPASEHSARVERAYRLITRGGA